MIYPPQLRDLIIRPTLSRLGLWSQAAENLLLGTAAQESRCGTYLSQLGGGPARGIYQMEQATHNDLVYRYLIPRPELYNRVLTELDRHAFHHSYLVGDLCYATVFCRLHYRRRPEALPDASDLEGLARYYKRFYNTPLGAASEDQFLENYRSLIQPFQEFEP